MTFFKVLGTVSQSWNKLHVFLCFTRRHEACHLLWPIMWKKGGACNFFQLVGLKINEWLCQWEAHVRRLIKLRNSISAINCFWNFILKLLPAFPRMIRGKYQNLWRTSLILVVTQHFPILASGGDICFKILALPQGI